MKDGRRRRCRRNVESKQPQPPRWGWGWGLSSAIISELKCRIEGNPTLSTLFQCSKPNLSRVKETAISHLCSQLHPATPFWMSLGGPMVMQDKTPQQGEASQVRLQIEQWI